jgi:hypothetical protein
MEDVISAIECRMGAPESWRSAGSLNSEPRAWLTLRSSTFGERIKLSGCDRWDAGLERVSSLCLIPPCFWIQ